MKKRLTSLLLAFLAVLSLLPSTALAAGPNTIKMEDCTHNGVHYDSPALGTCWLHQMHFDYNGKSVMGFCAEHGKGMGWSLNGHMWNDPKPISDPTVETMMAYFYAHSMGIFTDRAHALGVDQVWDSDYTWTMNAWVQAVIWRYKEGTLGDPTAACAEELLQVYNNLSNTSYTSIDDLLDGTSFWDRAQYILDLGAQGVWGECTVYEYAYAGPGSSQHPSNDVQAIIIGELSVTNEQYSLTIKKVDATNPNKGLPGARFLITSENGSYSKEVVTGHNGTVTVSPLDANTYAVTELEAPEGYEIDNAGPQYVVLPSGSDASGTATFTDTPIVTSEGTIRKVDADDPTKGLAGAVIKITGVDNGFVGTYTSGTGGYLTDIPWDTMPIGSYVAEEITPPEGYTKSTDQSKIKQSFEWDGKSDISLIFENDAKVKLQLIKLDDAGAPLSDCVFNVVKDGQIIASEKTDASGVITVPNVTEGMFAFVEVSAPEGYATLREPVIAHVDQATMNGGGTVTVTASNKKLPNLTILKRDKQTGDVIPDTHFEIRGIHYGYHDDVTTGPDGTATLTGIPVDSYEVTEKSVPAPFVVGDEPTQTIWLEAGDNKQLVFDNLKQPLLTLSKSEAGVEAFNPIPGTVFLVEGVDSDYRDEWTTGADGTVSKYVEPGSYQISEKFVPEPFYISKSDAERVEVVSLNPGDEKTVGFQNYRRPLVTVRKENAVTFDPLENAKFRVWWSSNHTDTGEIRDLGTYYTNELGEFTLDVEDGWLKITEVEAPKGFSLPDPATQERFITRGEEQKPFVFQDMPLSAICVWKYDSVKPNIAIENAVFQVRYLSGDTSGTGGTVIGTYKTSANGSFTITNCRAGTYIIEELSSDGSHVIDTPPQTVYLSGKDQEVVQVYFGNSPKGAVLVKKVSASDGAPLSDVEFFVTTADGAVVGSSNGKFVTDSNGSFLVENIDPNTTLIIKEIRAKPGFLLDDTPQTVQVKAGQTIPVEFRNQPMGNLIIEKWGRNGDKTVLLEGVKFEIKYANGQYVDAAGGKLSSNGIYYTNSNGQILLSGVTGTVIVTELESVAGYTIDPNTQSQTVTINPDDTQTLRFFNNAVGGVELIKVNEADRSQRIPNTTFEIRRMDDGLVDTVTTDSNGRVFVTLEDGSYYAVEIESNKKFHLDPTPHYFEVKDGRCEPVVVTNRKISGILLHKISSADGEGIPGVAFLLYDSQKNPIGQYTSDDKGYVRIEDIGAGRYYLRELENEGYVPDTQLRTVYVTDGTTTEVEWENTPITGQIQITKTSEDYNSMNGWPAGTPIPNTVFEIYHYRTGNLVDTIKTDKNGVAVSKPLPLGRYKIVESKAADYYGLDKTPIEAEIEHAGQIVKAAMTNKALYTNVSIKKTGYVEVMPGQTIRYDFSGIANNSTTSLTSFYWRDTLPTQAVRLDKIVTGTYNVRGNYKVVYKTNLHGEYRTMYDNLDTMRNYVLDASPAALGLASNEVVTEFMVSFGVVPSNFRQVEAPKVYCNVISTLTGGTQFTNQADVGGVYDGQWIMATSRWVTKVYKPSKPLPRTGY